MKIETEQVTCIHLTELEEERLDPIEIILRNYKPGCGEITIKCYKKAWTAGWGAMSGKRVEEFVTACDECYLISNLSQGMPSQIIDDGVDPAEIDWDDPPMVPNEDWIYLRRIVLAVQAGLREWMATNAV